MDDNEDLYKVSTAFERPCIGGGNCATKQIFLIVKYNNYVRKYYSNYSGSEYMVGRTVLNKDQTISKDKEN